MINVCAHKLVLMRTFMRYAERVNRTTSVTLMTATWNRTSLRPHPRSRPSLAPGHAHPYGHCVRCGIRRCCSGWKVCGAWFAAHTNDSIRVAKISEFPFNLYLRTKVHTQCQCNNVSSVCMWLVYMVDDCGRCLRATLH